MIKNHVAIDIESTIWSVEVMGCLIVNRSSIHYSDGLAISEENVTSGGLHSSTSQSSCKNSDFEYF